MSYTKTSLVHNGQNTKSAIAIPAWAQQMIDNGGELNTAVDAYNKTPQLYRAVQMRANALAAMPFVLHKNDKLTSWIYPQQLSKLLFEMEASLLVSGAAYLLKQQPAAGGKRTVGLQVLTPSSMRVHYDQRTRETTFTQQIRNETFGPWAADRLVYMREFSFIDEVGAGIAPAKVALPAASLRIAMSEFAQGFFSSGGQPLTLLSMQGNPPPQEIERTEKFFKRTMQGVRNAWRVLAVRSEVSVTPITPALNTMAMEELQTVTTREIAAAFGIPLSLLTSDSANYATAVSDQRLFYENTIRARLQMYESALNEQLLKETQTTIKFTPESLSIYQEDEAERSNALVNLVNAGMALRDAMLILGYSVEEVTGTDATVETISTAAPVPDGKRKSIAVSGLREQLADEYANNAHLAQVRNELKAWQRVATKSIERGREFECNEIPPELENWIKSHLQNDSAYLEHVFEDITQKGLQLRTKAEKAVAAKVRSVFRQYGNQIKAQAAAGIVDHVAANEMFTTLAQKITPVLKNVYTTQIQATETETGVPLDTERYKTAAQEWAEKYSYGELKSGLTKTTIDNVQRMVGKLVQDPSLTPATVAAGLFPTFSDYRVAMIATTEVTRAKAAAVNGYYDGLYADGLDVVRRWSTKLDEKVCPICGPLDNKKEETYKKKFNDGPPAHPNCRCRIGVEVKADNTEEGRGDLLPAPTTPKPVTPKPKPVAPKPVAPVTKLQTGAEILAAVRELAASDPNRAKVSNLRNELRTAELALEQHIFLPELISSNFPSYDEYWDAQQKYYNEYKILYDAVETIKTSIGFENYSVQLAISELLAVPNSIPLTLDRDPQFPKLNLQETDLLSNREKLIVKTVATWINPDIVPNPASFGTHFEKDNSLGSYYSPTAMRKSFINFGRGYTEVVIAHELGHFIDNETVAIDQATGRTMPTNKLTKQFFDKRTAGDAELKLSSALPRRGYEAKDVYKPDKWRDAYTGRIYGTSSDTEVLSNGLGYMFTDAVGFSEFDPDHFEITVNLLRGIAP